MTSGGPDRFFNFTAADYENMPTQPRPLTRSQKIELAKHQNFHIDNHTFDTSAELAEHMQLMAIAMGQGMSFDQSHNFALKLGPN